MNCLFCKMASGEVVPDVLIHKDETVMAFRDISPQAPVHALIIPRKHISGTNSLGEGHAALLSHMFAVAREIAEDEGIAETGYRLVLNCNEDGGQSVAHLHMHLLGGRRMQWPPG
jgi:histidine triad (HIT) family protein